LFSGPIKDSEEDIYNMVLIIGITGATGAIYGIRLLEVLSRIEVVYEPHAVHGVAS